MTMGELALMTTVPKLRRANQNLASILTIHQKGVKLGLGKAKVLPIVIWKLLEVNEPKLSGGQIR